MQSDHDQPPRLSKRLRGLDEASRFPPPSPTRSTSSEAVSDAFEAESHQTGRLSPVKQIQLLEDLKNILLSFATLMTVWMEQSPKMSR